MVASSISYEAFSKIAHISNLSNFIIKLKDDVNTLDAVTIKAGTFKAEWDMGSAKSFEKSITCFCEDIDKAIVLLKAEVIRTNCKKETFPN